MGNHDRRDTTDSPVSAFDSVLARMFRREGIDTLPAHLAEHHGLTVTKTTKLDVGVFRVERAEKAPAVVVRLFPRSRPYAAAEGDLAVLEYLAEVGFPAERPFAAAPLSCHDGQAVLVTEFVPEVPKPKRPPYPIVRLGAMIGHLHGLDVPSGADRPAGALHHFAEGTMTDELQAVAGWLDAIGAGAPEGDREALGALRTAVAEADGGDGLPEGLVHPDPVPKNVVFTAEGPVLVDWTAAGRGPRLASLTLVLKSGWAAAPFTKGYQKPAAWTDEERDRLAGLLFSRGLVGVVFGVCRDPSRAARGAKRLTALRRECDAQARELLAL